MRYLICVLFILSLAGCGGGNTPLALVELPFVPEPEDVISAEIISATVIVTDMTPSNVYFIANVEARNTGTVDLVDVYYRIEAEDLYWFTKDGFGFRAVIGPFTIYRGTTLFSTIPFALSTDTVFTVSGLDYPRAYRIKFVLCQFNCKYIDSESFSTQIVTVYIP